MVLASELFSEEQKRRINDAVGEAESKTSAEIVPVVATASGRYDRAEDVVGLCLALAAMVLAYLVFPQTARESPGWGRGASGGWAKLVVMLAVALIGFAGGTVLATYVGWLRRLFTPRRQMAEELSERARQVFFDNRVHHTAGGTGLCIYVSLYERMALILADQTVLDKLGQAALGELSSQLIDDLSRCGVTESICSAIHALGERLEPVLPRAEDDVNELSDALVTFD